MKIVIFGLTISSSWGNAHADAWRGLSHALAERGHRISYYERDLSLFANRRDIVEWADGELWLFSSWDKVRFRAKRDLLDADVAIITSGCPDAAAATTLVMDSPVPMRIFHDLDTPSTLDYEESRLPVAYTPPESLEPFDLVISHSGGLGLAELRTRLGAKRVAALHAGVDLAACDQAPPPDQRNARGGLSCLADYTFENGFGFDRLFADTAVRLPGLDFRLAGAGLQPGMALGPNVSYLQVISSGQRGAFFRSSRLLLSLGSQSQQWLGFSPTEALFQAMACGVPVVTQAADGLELFLQPGAEILTAQTVEDALSALELTDRELEGFASRAKARIEDEHTFAHRALHLETLIENTFNAAEEEELVKTRLTPAFEDSVAG